MGLTDRLTFAANRLAERLWFKPLTASIVSVAAVFIAKIVDIAGHALDVPSITDESIESILSVLAASMLVIATFAVASMVSAYASASNAATPRSFRLVVADDVSQNALSTFIGAFIFSIVALIAQKNDFFLEPGRAALFVMTVAVFAWVILTFVRWVDQIARLGRLGTTIAKVEAAAMAAIERRRAAPRLGGVPPTEPGSSGLAVPAASGGYVQRVDVGALQSWASKHDAWVSVEALPGTFAMQGRPLARVRTADGRRPDAGTEHVAKAFTIGSERLFEEDPRFGLVVLSEIADKALSPGINDPGTAIAILGSFARLFTAWASPLEERPPADCDRVEVPALSVHDMFDDAFTAIARDGAATIEVVLRLQKVLGGLATLPGHDLHEAAKLHSRLAMARAEQALTLPHDVERARSVAAHAQAS